MEERNSHTSQKHSDTAAFLSCVYCAEQFDVQWLLRLHVHEEHISILVKCWLPLNCYSYFLDEEARDEHILTAHDPKIKLICQCCRLLLPLEELVQHRKSLNFYPVQSRVVDRRPPAYLQQNLSCELCGSMYSNLAQLMDHVLLCFSSKIKTDAVFHKAVLNSFQFCRQKSVLVGENADVCQIDFDQLQEETLSETLWAVEKLHIFNYLTKKKRSQPLVPTTIVKMECLHCDKVLDDWLQARQHAIQAHKAPMLSHNFCQLVDRYKILEQIELKCCHCERIFSAKILGLHLAPRPCWKCRLKVPCEFLLLEHCKSCDLTSFLRQRLGS